MRKSFLILFVALLLAVPAQAQMMLDDVNWTEFQVTSFDKIDGQFKPTITGTVVNFIGEKGIGAFLGMDNAIGPVFMWRTWKQTYGGITISLYFISSSDIWESATERDELFSNVTTGLEPRFYIPQFGNAEVALGLLNTRFVEDEKAEMTYYFKLAFRP